jgi:hypothetical protein
MGRRSCSLYPELARSRVMMYPLWCGRSEPEVGRGEDFSWGRGRGRARMWFLPRPRLRPSPGVGRGGDHLPRPEGRARRSFLLRPRLNSAVVVTYCRWFYPGGRHSSRSGGERRCFPVRSVSERAKWLRSLRPCRLRRACQDKVSGDPRIECACDTVGW